MTQSSQRSRSGSKSTLQHFLRTIRQQQFILLPHGLYGPNSILNACKHKYCGLGKHCVVDYASGEGECQCLDRCKPHYKPVCGSNGKFYPNHCELHRASCLAHERITIVHSEECFYKGKEWKKYPYRI
ncbi:follistatin-related protein 5 isoform X1 [Tachysurus ichikawai]